MDILAQVFGLGGSALNIYSYQMKSNRWYYFFQGAGSALFTVNFFMLGAYTSALLNILSLFRGLVLAAGKKWSNWYVYALFEVAFLAAGIATYSGFPSVLITVAQLVSTTTMWLGNGKTIRVVQFFFVSPAWLYNNAVVFSLGGILTESFALISILVSFLRYGWNGFEKER